MTTTAHPAPTGEIGRSRVRVEDQRLITGAGHYVEDMRLPGTLYLAFVRSPYPHAHVRGIIQAFTAGIQYAALVCASEYAAAAYNARV